MKGKKNAAFGMPSSVIFKGVAWKRLAEFEENLQGWKFFAGKFLGLGIEGAVLRICMLLLLSAQPKNHAAHHAERQHDHESDAHIIGLQSIRFGGRKAARASLRCTG